MDNKMKLSGNLKSAKMNQTIHGYDPYNPWSKGCKLSLLCIAYTWHYYWEKGPYLTLGVQKC
jgi:hypothetical protein